MELQERWMTDGVTSEDQKKKKEEEEKELKRKLEELNKNMSSSFSINFR